MAQKAKHQNPAPPPAVAPLFPSLTRHSAIGSIIAALYGLLMLAVGLKYHVVGDYGVETDFFWSYVPQARDILVGKFIIEDFRGPGYPVVLAFGGMLSRNFFMDGIILSTCSAALALFFSFETLKRLFSPDLAFVATLLVAVNATFVQYTYSAGTDMLFCAFVLGFVFFLLRDETRRWGNIAAAALCAALAYLTRYNGIYVLLAVPVVVGFVNPFKLERKERAKTVIVFVAAFFVCIAPWGFYCLKERGSFFYNRNYLNIAYEMFAKGRIGWDQYWSVESTKFHSLGQVIFSDAGLFISTVSKNVVEHLFNDLTLLLGWLVGLFAVIGVVLFVREGVTRRQVSFILVEASFFAVLLLVFYGERFSLALLPLYCVVAARTCSWRKLSSVTLFGGVRGGTLAALLLLGVSVVNAYQYNRATIDSGPREVPVIADWFLKHSGPVNPETIVLTRKPHIAYYLGMTMTMFPLVSTLDELHAGAVNVKASYLFFSSIEAGMRPQFEQLLDPRNAPAWLTPVAYTVAPPAVLYKIN